MTKFKNSVTRKSNTKKKFYVKKDFLGINKKQKRGSIQKKKTSCRLGG